MRFDIVQRCSRGSLVDSTNLRHKNFTTKQKAQICKILERINVYKFEVEGSPKKLYSLNDVYRILNTMVSDGRAENIDCAIKILQERIK